MILRTNSERCEKNVVMDAKTVKRFIATVAFLSMVAITRLIMGNGSLK